MAEFSNLGTRCAAEGCALKDFLPFTCDACSKVFCLEHRVYETHRCPVGHSAKDVRVFLCPICDKSVKIRLDEDINLTWTRHSQTECAAAQKKKSKAAKARCSERGCSTKLRTTNTIRCQKCGRTSCIMHRHHDCAAVRREAAQRAAAVRTSGTRGQKLFFGGGGGNNKNNGNNKSARKAPRRAATAAAPTAAPAVGGGQTSWAASATAAAAATRRQQQREEQQRRRRQQQQQQQSHYHEAGGRNQQCPHCRLQFADPVALVAHVEGHEQFQRRQQQQQQQLAPALPPPAQYQQHQQQQRTRHAAAAPPAAPAGERFQCPRCPHLEFRDAAAVVRHFDAAHGSAEEQRQRGGVDGSNCALS